MKPRLPILARAVLPLYEAAWLVAAAGWALFLVARRSADWRRELRERLGCTAVRPSSASRSIWIHAVSVGELLSILPVIEAIKRRDRRAWILLTVSNDAAFALAQRRATQADAVCRTPWDAAWCVRRALRRSKPDVLAVVECELWPNLILRAADSGAKTVLVNARVYERDFGRYRLARAFFRPILERISGIHVQSDDDRRRFLSLGASEDRVRLGGNTKFDAAPAAPSGDVAELVDEVRGGGPIWVLASTHEPEERAILKSAGELFMRRPRMRIVVAPRDVARGEAVARTARELGYSVRRRTERGGDAPFSVFVLDSLGELSRLMAIADVVFVGGSLVAKGGHNPIEAAAFAKPIVVGPYTFNFSDVVAKFVECDAIRIIGDAMELCREVGAILGDPRSAEALGRRAKEVVERERGASERYAAMLLEREPASAAA